MTFELDLTFSERLTGWSSRCTSEWPSGGSQPEVRWREPNPQPPVAEVQSNEISHFEKEVRPKISSTNLVTSWHFQENIQENRHVIGNHRIMVMTNESLVMTHYDSLWLIPLLLGESETVRRECLEANVTENRARISIFARSMTPYLQAHAQIGSAAGQIAAINMAKPSQISQNAVRHWVSKYDS